MPAPTSVLIREIPLFPLPEVVLFPQAELPLHIYENRYKQMVNNLLKTDKQFGVLFLDNKSGKAFSTGCTAEIKHALHLPDGRINIRTRGLKRFKLLEITEHEPYLVGLVKWLMDDPPKADLLSLQQEANILVNNIVRLTNKLTKSLMPGCDTNEHIRLPLTLPDNPESFSFWVANNLFSDPYEKQALLALTDTKLRLEQQINSLKVLSKELIARAAIEDAFSPSLS
jgi:ATP-dependent Lon protease